VTKHGVVTLSETLAFDLEAAGSKVGVSVLCPGFVDTQIWDSERNRDESTMQADPAGGAEGTEQTKALMKAVLMAGLPPAEVAGLVVDAIRGDRFYIFTHEGTKTAVRDRMRGILESDRPVPPEGGAAIFMK